MEMRTPCGELARLSAIFLLAVVILAEFICADDAFAPGKMFALKAHDSIPSSVIYWDDVMEAKKISILSAVVEHRHEGNWYIPSLHEKYSVGWNRTSGKGNNRPTACNIRFVGLGLASNLKGFEGGGSGYMTFHFLQEGSKKGHKHLWHGFDKNESNKLYCYYETGLQYGSNFIDKPKTLGVAVYCPLSMDDEVGAFNYRDTMREGYFCRAMAEHPVEVEVFLRPTDYAPPRIDMMEEEYVGPLVTSRVVTAPAAQRLQTLRAIGEEETPVRVHAACTVQTFRNQQTGPMMHLFAAYYLAMGWRVIIYDRFGFHREFLTDFMNLPGFHYHPYTVFQLAMPSKYNDEYASKQTFDLKCFYKTEINWGFNCTSQADTADQDQDKTKTYDLIRLEYAHLDSILYVDSDELFYCPQAGEDIPTQRRYQQRIMSDFSMLGVEEMRFVRLPYSALAPDDFPRNITKRTAKQDFTFHVTKCMQKAYESRATTGMTGMFKCWSSAIAMDNFPKSADFAGKCPFHYNHWSCDGGRSGGRDLIPRCRCKVSLDLNNFYEFRPMVKRCHLLHFNDNAYSYQARREQHKWSHGSFFKQCPVANMLEGLNKATIGGAGRHRPDGEDIETHTGIKKKAHHNGGNHGHFRKNAAERDTMK